MPVEQRKQVTHITGVNGQPEELLLFDGRRQPSMGGTSRMNREVHVRICERLGVKFPGPTRQIRPLRGAAEDGRSTSGSGKTSAHAGAS